MLKVNATARRSEGILMEAQTKSKQDLSNLQKEVKAWGAKSQGYLIKIAELLKDKEGFLRENKK